MLALTKSRFALQCINFYHIPVVVLLLIWQAIVAVNVYVMSKIKHQRATQS